MLVFYAGPPVQTGVQQPAGFLTPSSDELTAIYIARLEVYAAPVTQRALDPEGQEWDCDAESR